jgi:hypothetical protein
MLYWQFHQLPIFIDGHNESKLLVGLSSEASTFCLKVFRTLRLGAFLVYLKKGKNGNCRMKVDTCRGIEVTSHLKYKQQTCLENWKLNHL